MSSVESSYILYVLAEIQGYWFHLGVIFLSSANMGLSWDQSRPFISNDRIWFSLLSVSYAWSWDLFIQPWTSILWCLVFGRFQIRRPSKSISKRTETGPRTIFTYKARGLVSKLMSPNAMSDTFDTSLSRPSIRTENRQRCCGHHLMYATTPSIRDERERYTSSSSSNLENT